jgi:uncharacterized protein (DUF934 family)
MQIIDRNLQIVDDGWTLLDDEAPLGDGDVIVSLARWHRDRDALAAHRGRVGLKLAPDTKLEDIAEELARFDLIALDFPSFVDGRGFSLARLLQDRHHYTGELRAVGDVQRDQIDFMRRCGIDSFALRADKDAADALKAFKEFTIRYQPAADEAVPVYRRR